MFLVHGKLRQGCITINDTQDIVQVMRQATGQFTDGFYLLRVNQLLVNVFLFGDIFFDS